MNFIDTHTHLYLADFNDDIENVVQNALDLGISEMLLPNIDSKSIDSMKRLKDKFPLQMHSMMGLHPTNVFENFESELAIIENELSKGGFCAVGEIGIDLYWDKQFFEQQKIALRYQLDLALQFNLPVCIHSRNSHNEVMEVMNEYKSTGLKAVFHCFSGDANQAKELVDRGFYLGIGGVISFKNSGLAEAIKGVPLENILLETDAPYLAPTPFRGKRNESAYIKIIAEHVATLYRRPIEEIAFVTTQNAKTLFNL